MYGVDFGVVKLGRSKLPEIQQILPQMETAHLFGLVGSYEAKDGAPCGR